MTQYEYTDALRSDTSLRASRPLSKAVLWAKNWADQVAKSSSPGGQTQNAEDDDDATESEDEGAKTPTGPEPLSLHTIMVHRPKFGNPISEDDREKIILAFRPRPRPTTGGSTPSTTGEHTPSSGMLTPASLTSTNPEAVIYTPSSEALVLLSDFDDESEWIKEHEAWEHGLNILIRHEKQTRDDAQVILPQRLACVYGVYTQLEHLSDLIKEIKGAAVSGKPLSEGANALIEQATSEDIVPKRLPKIVKSAQEYFDGNDRLGEMLSLQALTHFGITSHDVMGCITAIHSNMFYGTATGDQEWAEHFGHLLDCCTCEDKDFGSSLAPSSRATPRALSAGLGRTPQPSPPGQPSRKKIRPLSGLFHVEVAADDNDEIAEGEQAKSEAT